MVTLIIDGQLAGLNEYTRACRGNKYVGAQMKKEAENLISWHIKEQLKGIHFDAPVRLAFRWFEPNRKRDNGIIKTDGWKGVIGFTDEFFTDKNPRIEVDISPEKES